MITVGKEPTKTRAWTPPDPVGRMLEHAAEAEPAPDEDQATR
jgi:hypothetical protein